MPYCSYFFCYCVCMGSGRGKSRRVRFLAGAIRRARGVGIPPFTSEAERSHPKDGVYTDKNGTRTWWKSNKPHRDGGPAVETRDGNSGLKDTCTVMVALCVFSLMEHESGGSMGNFIVWMALLGKTMVGWKSGIWTIREYLEKLWKGPLVTLSLRSAWVRLSLRSEERRVG